MLVIDSIKACRDAVHALSQMQGRVGFVPTMGALHRGHLSLIEIARKHCDAVVVSIFVNPTQFSPDEDFDAYPRPMDEDLRACSQSGVDLVFAPTAAIMYPQTPRTTIHVTGLSDGLCGRLRAGHFDGVATVVTKLFGIVPAQAAFFGDKDYQQLAVVRQLVRDLNIPIEIVGCPIVREASGLAMSSRNAYLSSEQRTQAASLSCALFQAREQVKAGERCAATLTEAMRRTILEAGVKQIEYMEVVHPDSLVNVESITDSARICLAVRIGSCRLIDNIGVDVS